MMKGCKRRLVRERNNETDKIKKERDKKVERASVQKGECENHDY